MVNLRINWTLYTGEECKAKTNYATYGHNLETSPTEAGKMLFIFQVYHSFSDFCGFSEGVASWSLLLQGRVGKCKA